MSRSRICSINKHRAHTHFLPSHTHTLSHWDCAVSGARLMSHGGHFSSLSFSICSPLHEILLFCMLNLFLQSLLINHPITPSSSSFLLSHLLLRFHFSTFLIAFPSPSLSPPIISLLSVLHTYLPVSCYAHSSLICSMWNLPQKDISSWTERTERNVCFYKKT